MVRLTSNDGAPTHLRRARFHIRATSRYPNTKPIGATMQPIWTGLKESLRTAEDLLDLQTDATADCQIADAIANDRVRTVHNEARSADLADPSTGAVAALFPLGLEVAIAPTGESQAKECERLAGAAANMPALQKHVQGLTQDAAELRATEAAQTKAFENTGTALGKVRLLTGRIREQFEANEGALRILFKANPKAADRFFFSGRRRSRNTEPDDPVDV